jgi:hypothetical protein
MKLIYSSKSILNHQSYSKESYSRASIDLRSLYAVFHPFNQAIDSNNINIDTNINSATIACSSCGSFINPYVALDWTTSRWSCPFCRSDNLPFYPDTVNSLASDALKESYVRQTWRELDSPMINYLQVSSDLVSNATAASSDTALVLLIPLDQATMICDVLFDCLDSLSERVDVSIILYSQCLHVLRLSDILSDAVLTADVLPGHRDRSSHLKANIAQGTYFVAKNDVSSHQSIISSCIRSISGLSDDDRGICSVQTIISALTTIRQHARHDRLHTISFNSRSYPLTSGLSSDAANHRLNEYSQEGRRAAKEKVLLDIICAGEHGIHFDKLVSLAGGSGGNVKCQAPSFDDELVKMSLRKLFERQQQIDDHQGLSRQSSPVTIEVRCSSGLTIVSYQLGCAANYESDAEGARHLPVIFSPRERRKSFHIDDYRGHDDDSLILQLVSDSDHNQSPQSSASNNLEYIQVICRRSMTMATGSGSGCLLTRCFTDRFNRIERATDFFPLVSWDVLGTALISLLVKDYHRDLCHRIDGAVKLYSSTSMTRTASKDDMVLLRNASADNLVKRIDALLFAAISLIRDHRSDLPYLATRLKAFLRQLYHLRYGHVFDGNTTVVSLDCYP